MVSRTVYSWSPRPLSRPPPQLSMYSQRGLIESTPLWPCEPLKWLIHARTIMSATVVIPQQQQQQPVEVVSNARGGGYRAFLTKPARLWQRNKTAPLLDPSSADDTNKLRTAATVVASSTATATKKPKVKLSLALRETAANNVFKMSTINDSGVYLPPSPCEDSKRDHWLEMDQDELIFRLPSPDRLTKDHCFYTPSATI
ncbi:hypothetical protein BX666DRAFT_1438777 [Dichotomocladium elegans]|nr:hypothetical protein BX666DRAFT_1438777 [Dichotomocladium elegans]